MAVHTLDYLAERFRIFSTDVFPTTSRLFETFSRNILDDPETLALAIETQDGQPIPNMLFGAVHYLLLKGESHRLRDYYPTLTETPLPPQEAYPDFCDFCHQHGDAIRALVKSRRVQTNEVRRCALTVPAFGMIAKIANQPLALIEIGTSAGLNLLWDYYRFAYSDGAQTGNPQSPVDLTCALRGDYAPPIPNPLPEVASRVGIDINPIDPLDEDETLWLKALIWPEYVERFTRMDHALAIAREHPPKSLKGDALELLPDVFNDVSADSALCVYHSFTVNQFSKAMRERLEAILTEQSRLRVVYRISLEWEPDKGGSALRLITYHNGNLTDKLLALCHPHGEFMEWLDSSA
jgi:hypothetical protein